MCTRIYYASADVKDTAVVCRVHSAVLVERGSYGNVISRAPKWSGDVLELVRVLLYSHSF